MCGTTGIVDHHESPNAIDGSLDVIAEACAEVGVRVVCAYGVTDRHGAEGARRGLDENDRFLRAGGRGLVGVHAAFTCADETLEAAAGLAADLGVGVHIHVAEGPAESRRAPRWTLAADEWLLVHCVLLDRSLPGRSPTTRGRNMNNARRLRRPGATDNTIVLGTDGIGADMLEEFRLAYVAHRVPTTSRPRRTRRGRGSRTGIGSSPSAADDRVDVDLRPRRLAVARGVHAGHPCDRCRQRLRRGAARRRRPTRVDLAEVRAHAAEQAARLFARL